MSNFLDLSVKLLTKNGVLCTINKYNNSEFNVNTGNYEKVIDKTDTSFYIFTNFAKGEFKEDINFSNKEKGILLMPFDFELEVGSEIILLGKKYNALRIIEVFDKETIVLYKVIVKENDKQS